MNPSHLALSPAQGKQAHMYSTSAGKKETFDTTRQLRGKWKAFSRQKLNPWHEPPVLWTSKLCMTIRQPPSLTILYVYCTGGTECLSHTLGNHSVCAIKTRLEEDQKYASSSRTHACEGGCCGTALAAQHRAIPAAARFSHSQLRQDDAPV